MPYDDIRVFQSPGTVVTAWGRHGQAVLVCVLPVGRWSITGYLGLFSLITTGNPVLALDHDTCCDTERERWDE